MAKSAAGPKRRLAVTSTSKRSAAKPAAKAATITGKKTGVALKPAVKKVAPRKLRAAASPRIAGTTSDGVVVFHSAVKPTHFTSDEIRTTIREYLRRK